MVGTNTGRTDMPREILYEFTRIGTMLKCAAIDPETNTEVFVVGPLSASQRDLQTLAMKKLERKLKGEG